MSAPRKILAFCVTAGLVLFGCDRPLTIDGAAYVACGLLDPPGCMSDGVQYSTVIGNIVLSAICVETIIIPVWLIGFRLWEPVGKKPTKSASEDNRQFGKGA